MTRLLGVPYDMVSWAINLCSPAAEKDTSSSGKPTIPEKRKWRRNVFNNFHSNSEKSFVNPVSVLFHFFKMYLR